MTNPVAGSRMNARGDRSMIGLPSAGVPLESTLKVLVLPT